MLIRTNHCQNHYDLAGYYKFTNNCDTLTIQKIMSDAKTSTAISINRNKYVTKTFTQSSKPMFIFLHVTYAYIIQCAVKWHTVNHTVGTHLTQKCPYKQYNSIITWKADQNRYYNTCQTIQKHNTLMITKATFMHSAPKIINKKTTDLRRKLCMRKQNNKMLIQPVNFPVRIKKNNMWLPHSAVLPVISAWYRSHFVVKVI
jgi:hypothetical protein